MSRGIGKIQRKVLQVLETIDPKWYSIYSVKDRDEHWVQLNRVIILLYHPEQMDRSLGYYDWSYSKNEHRRIWESVTALKRRGYLETRIRMKHEGRIGGVWGGIQKRLEVRIKDEHERKLERIEQKYGIKI